MSAKPDVPFGTIIHVVEDEKEGLRYAYDQYGNDIIADVPYHVVRRCMDSNQCAMFKQTPNGGQWRMVSYAEYESAKPKVAGTAAASKTKALTQAHVINVEKINITAEDQEDEQSHSEVVMLLKNAIQYKPALLKLPELTWRFAFRAAVRGENLLLLGDAGTGKTLLAQTLPKVLNRPFFYFNMGATQDARSTLIGNTHFKEGEGTYVAESLFVKAIQTPNAVILLDELTRIHPDGQNILMPVLDKKQRYLRVDESPDSPTIPVAKGVCFVGTANVGTEYTATRTLDRALMDRFTLLKIPHLKKDEEVELLREMFPSVDGDVINSVAEIAEDTRIQVKTDNPKVSTIISTRKTVEMVALLYDGFTLAEVAQVCIFPFYSEAGGPDSEQAYVRALVQRYAGKSSDASNDPTLGTNNPDSVLGF